jgi:hypothetical protein
MWDLRFLQQWKFISELCHHAPLVSREVGTNISEEQTTSIYMSGLQQYVLLKCWYLPTRLHGVIT